MKEVKPWVRPALEYGPLILFFAVFMVMRSRTVMLGGTEYGGFIVATMIFVPVLALTTFALWRLTGKVSAMQLLTLVLVVVFGGLTIWLNDERFLKMKVTIIYAIFAGLLSLGLVLRKNWLELVMGEALPMRHEGWMKLTFRMVLLFIGLAIANELIWRNLSDTAWVNFKTFGLTAAIFVFFMTQGRVFRDYGTGED